MPPARTRAHALRLLRDVFAHRPASTGTDLGAALTFARRVLRRRAIVALVSDFAVSDVPTTTPAASSAGGMARPLALLAAHHDVVALRLTDAADAVLPAAGLVAVEDAETGEVRLVDAANAAVRQSFARAAEDRAEGLRQIFARAGVDAAEVGTGDDAFSVLSAFFARRNRRPLRRTSARAA